MVRLIIPGESRGVGGGRKCGKEGGAARTITWFACCNTTSKVCRLRRRHRLILDATATQSYTYLGRVRWRSKLFFGHGFFLRLGRRGRGSNYTGTAYSEDWARGKWALAWNTSMEHGFTSHQEPGSLISGRELVMSNSRCGWSPVTVGPAFESW